MEVAGGRLTVLAVGDDDTFAAAAVAHLERVGADVVPAVDASDARGILTRSRAEIDCVVSPDDLSGGDVLSFVEQVRSEWPALPVVVVADDESSMSRDDAFRAGVAAYARRRAVSEQYVDVADRIVNAVTRSRVRCEPLRGRSSLDAADDAGLQYLVAFQNVVLDASALLMSAELDEIETKVRWTLERVGEFTGVDRCYVFEMDDDERPMHCHEWNRDGVSTPRVTVSDRHYAESRLVERLARFENVHVRDTAGLRRDEPLARELFTGCGTAVVVPLVSNWELRGFVGFETTRGRRAWSDGEISILRTVADTIAHTLERQRREETLQRQNERLDTFASAVSHDLRNPLNVVSGFIELAQQTGDVEHLERASSAVDRMEELIVDVLALARQGRTVGDVTTVSLDTVVEEAWLAVETERATLWTDDLETVVADRDRLLTVFENLFRNAVDHAGETSSIRVGELDAGGFYVEDDGRGIPAAERAHVFEEGYSTDSGGSGLGLAIVSNVVDAHEWQVDVTTGSEGGARFEVWTAPRTRRSSSRSSAECLD